MAAPASTIDRGRTVPARPRRRTSRGGRRPDRAPARTRRRADASANPAACHESRCARLQRRLLPLRSPSGATGPGLGPASVGSARTRNTGAARSREASQGRPGPAHQPLPVNQATAPQLRRFIKSRPYVPMHELRRRFAIDGGDDDVTPVHIDRHWIFVGLPEREGGLLGELLRAGRDRLRAVARSALADRRRCLSDAARPPPLTASGRRTRPAVNSISRQAGSPDSPPELGSDSTLGRGVRRSRSSAWPTPASRGRSAASVRWSRAGHRGQDRLLDLGHGHRRPQGVGGDLQERRIHVRDDVGRPGAAGQRADLAEEVAGRHRREAVIAVIGRDTGGRRRRRG